MFLHFTISNFTLSRVSVMCSSREHHTHHGLIWRAPPVLAKEAVVITSRKSWEWNYNLHSYALATWYYEILRECLGLQMAAQRLKSKGTQFHNPCPLLCIMCWTAESSGKQITLKQIEPLPLGKNPLCFLRIYCVTECKMRALWTQTVSFPFGKQILSRSLALFTVIWQSNCLHLPEDQ